MRTLLIFTGSIIHFIVMVIISPLLLIVYSGLHSVYLMRYIKQQRYFQAKTFTFHIPQFRFSLKEYAHSLWEKAIHFHF